MRITLEPLPPQSRLDQGRHRTPARREGAGGHNRGREENDLNDGDQDRLERRKTLARGNKKVVDALVYSVYGVRA